MKKQSGTAGKQPNYKKTLVACYFGLISQAICANFTPLLFLNFKNQYHVGLDSLTLIPLFFFITQILMDIFAAKFVDKIGYRICAVVSQAFCAAGIFLMGILPDLFPNPFVGILISVVIYAMGSGLVELVSPIIEACPFENKARVMGTLHSFYCWGSVGVILLSTLFFSIFGISRWKILAMIWAIFPLLNLFNFLSCPMEKLTEEGEGLSAGKLCKMPLFWLFILIMICVGASECMMSQWASAFTESALGVSKTVGDLAGPCLFSFLMGISRLCYGKMSEKFDLVPMIIGCGLLCTLCYLTASLSSLPIIGLAGCALCGMVAGIMWPGTLSVSSQKCPTGGTTLFSFLALAGDFGASVGPSLVGNISNLAGGNLKTGLLAAAIFPLLLSLGFFIMQKKYKQNPNKNV